VRASVVIAFAGVVVGVASLAPKNARAQSSGEAIRDAADRVASEWRKAGAVVERGPARFLYENETMTLTLPASNAGDKACTTIALLGARGLSFHAKVAGADDDAASDDTQSRAASFAGILEIGECGDGAEPLERLRVTSDAGRGAIETVVGRSVKALPALRSVLPERTGGVLPPPPDAGPPPPLPSPPARADLAETRAKHDGAKIAPRASWTATNDGSGDAKVALEPGCHRVEVFAPVPRARDHVRRRRLDVDAEIRDGDDELLARDRTDNADARLEACVGEETASTVIFAGAPPGSELTVTHASWPIPSHLPTTWGPTPRARMARALLARRAGAPPEDAVALFAGPSGSTPIPIAVEPGACYLAVAAVTHGHAHGLGLRVALGARDARDERTSDDDAGVVAFCARDQDRARLEVEARGTSLAWGLALFRVEGRVWGAP
jgi:hypothetical protein